MAGRELPSNTVAKMIENVLSSVELSPSDNKLFNSILDSIKSRLQQSKFNIASSIFLDCWKTSMAATGPKSHIFLIRDQRLAFTWRRVWNAIKSDIIAIEYNGTDPMEIYVLSQILNASSIEFMVDICKQESSSQMVSDWFVIDEAERTSDFGVYDFDDALVDQQLPAIDIEPLSFEVGESSTRQEPIPSPLDERYRHQAVYLVNSSVRLLLSKSDQSSTQILDLLKKLATEQRDETGKRTMQPSTDFLDILFLIDQRARELLQSRSFDDMMSLLRNDQSAIAEVRLILRRVDQEMENLALDFFAFIIDVSARSIWKTLMTQGRRNHDSGTSMAFRSNVQAREMNI